MTDATALGQAGLQGWRATVGERVAPPLARRLPVTEDQVRALVGAAFFVLSVLYVYKSVATAVRQVRR